MVGFPGLKGPWSPCSPGVPPRPPTRASQTPSMEVSSKGRVVLFLFSYNFGLLFESPFSISEKSACIHKLCVKFGLFRRNTSCKAGPKGQNAKFRFTDLNRNGIHRSAPPTMACAMNNYFDFSGKNQASFEKYFFPGASKMLFGFNIFFLGNFTIKKGRDCPLLPFALPTQPLAFQKYFFWTTLANF